MKFFSFNSDIRKQPPKGVFIEAIWKSRDGHLGVSITIGISIGINMAKKLFLCSEFFFFLVFWKNKIFMFVYMLSYGISTTLLQILISLRFPVHTFKGIHWCFEKRLFELSEASVHWCFEKITSPKISGCFPAKHLGWINIKYTHRPVWDFSKKLFRAAIL